jgi:phenylacetate-CoA ligase
VVDRTASLGRVEVQVEPAPSLLVRCGGAWADRHPEVEALRRYAGERLRTAIGLSVDVRLVAPHTIPRSEGKAVRVVERT